MIAKRLLIWGLFFFATGSMSASPARADEVPVTFLAPIPLYSLPVTDSETASDEL